ncbi:MAG: NmrA family NAD(P)-binding protein [Acidobacteriia bacterium]|nr:NmrA family NAD(P)-binding protein [Terriglobia bacterium]
MYVVIGATGNTGNIVARNLIAKGQEVRVIGRSPERLRTLAAQGAEPFACDITDAGALTKAFTNARAVYAMMPPDLTSPDFRAHQDRATGAIAAALERAGVKHAVSLSSIGADKTEKTGPVVGLHYLEQQLNRIAGLNVLHLRAGYFMENTLPQIGIIQSMGITAGPLRPDLKVPMIATRDIGAIAAEALLKLNFTSHETRELLGQRDLTMTEVTAVIGKAIKRPTLAYNHPPDEQLRPALTQMGMSLNVANLLLEMAASLNSGYMVALEKRSAQNTTPTSFETFVAEEFVPRFQGKSATA